MCPSDNSSQIVHIVSLISQGRPLFIVGQKVKVRVAYVSLQISLLMITLVELISNIETLIYHASANRGDPIDVFGQFKGHC